MKYNIFFVLLFTLFYEVLFADNIKNFNTDTSNIDTINYAQTIGYNTDSILLDLKIKSIDNITEIIICLNDYPDSCLFKKFYGKMNMNQLESISKDLLSKLLNTTGNAIKAQLISNEVFIDIAKNIAIGKDKSIKENKKDEEKQKIIQNVRDIYNENSYYKKIGYFEMKDSVTVLKTVAGEKPTTEVLKIKSVDVNISMGSIIKNGILVVLEDGSKFRNKHIPISLYRFDKNKSKLLDILDTRNSKRRTIELGDVLDYTYKGKYTYPTDNSILLSTEKKIDTVSASTSLKELLDVSIYSDLLALLGRKANGIIQTEINTTFITNTQNLGKKDIIFNNFLNAYFKLSKFDSRFSHLDSIYFSGAKDSLKVNRLTLNQLSYLQAGLKTNILKFGIGHNQQLFLNLGGDINLTNADSIFNKDLVSINYYPELVHTINNISNFGLEVSLKYIHQFVSKSSPFLNKEQVRILNPSFTIFYHPFVNPNNKIYLRYAHFAQVSKGEKYSYPQFQFGFKTFLFANKVQI